MKRVAVLGGGIAGLATAFRIRQEAQRLGAPVQITVVEAGAKPGGKVQSLREGGFVCEAGPQGFLDNEPATLRLVDDLGIRDRLLPSRKAAARRFIYRKNKFHELAMSPPKFLASSLMSWGGKFSMMAEFFRAPKTDGEDESVRSFGERRLGKEFTDVMLDSMVSGIHAGDISRISISAAFPKIAVLEREYGGLFKGMLAKRKEAKKAAREGRGEAQKVEAGPGGVLHSFDTGMVVPIEALAEQLGVQNLRLATRAVKLQPYRDGYRIFLEDAGGQSSTIEVDAVVAAMPAPKMAELFADFDPDLAQPLAEVQVAGVHVVCLGYAREQVKGDVEGFGTLIPRTEGLRTLGILYVHATFEGHAPSDQVLLRAMVGGRHDPEASALGDDELQQMVEDEMVPRLKIDGAPSFVRIFRWNEGIPQYELGHLDRIDRAREMLKRHPGIFLTGNSICGIAFNSVIAHSEEIGREVAEYLTHATNRQEAPA